jgi:hypothetical protein
MKENKWAEYERRKSEVAITCKDSDDYLRKIKEIAKELKI